MYIWHDQLIIISYEKVVFSNTVNDQLILFAHEQCETKYLSEIKVCMVTVFYILHDQRIINAREKIEEQDKLFILYNDGGGDGVFYLSRPVDTYCR